MKIVKYLLLYLPCICGIVLFSFGVVNLFSSLLLFLGGYIAIKNTFDYRLNKDINLSTVKKESINVVPREVNNVNIKRVKRNIRVRKRVKE